MPISTRQTGGTRGRARLAIDLVFVLALATLLTFFLLYEVIFALPLPLWLYALGAAMVVLSAVAADGSRRRWRMALSVATLTFLAILWAVPWTPRKAFTRHLDKIESGMTRSEVREAMHPYSALDEGVQRTVYGRQGSGRGALEVVDVYRSDGGGRVGPDQALIIYEGARVRETRFYPD